MQFCTKKISLLVFLIGLTGCADPNRAVTSRLEIRHAIVHAQNAELLLNAAIVWHPSREILEALDHGIVLDLKLLLRAETDKTVLWWSRSTVFERHLELRYYPLSRQYQLRDRERNSVRSFATRAYLFDALEQLHLPIELMDVSNKTIRYSLSVSLDTAALPGALRLTAWFDPNWHVSAQDYTWAAPNTG